MALLTVFTNSEQGRMEPGVGAIAEALSFRVTIAQEVLVGS